MLNKLVLVCVVSSFFGQSVKSYLPKPLEVLKSTLVRICEDLLRETSTSRTEFWFIKETDVALYAEDLLDDLIVSDPIEKYPKFLLDENGEFVASKHGIPTLAVVFLGSNGYVSLKAQTLNFITCICFVFLVGNESSSDFKQTCSNQRANKVGCTIFVYFNEPPLGSFNIVSTSSISEGSFYYRLC